MTLENVSVFKTLGLLLSDNITNTLIGNWIEDKCRNIGSQDYTF